MEESRFIIPGSLSVPIAQTFGNCASSYLSRLTDEEPKAQNLIASLGATTHLKAVTINHVILLYCLILFQEIYHKLRSILNKLTPQKFQTLTQQISELEIDTLERLEGVIDLIFEKVCTVVLV